MLRFLFSFVSALFCAGALHAACAGQDLRGSLTGAQRADLEASVAVTPYATGNHWRATRGDEMLHLIGTIHLDHPKLAAPLQRLEPVIEQADLLLLEMTPAEHTQLQAAMAEDPSLLMLQGQTLIDLMPENQWAKLAEAARARGIPPFMAAKFQPWYLSVTLALPPCVMAQMAQGADGLDAQLTAQAEQAGVTMRALESFDTVIKVFADAPLDQQIEMMSAGILSDQDSENQLATTFATYFDEAVAEGWHVARVLAPDQSGMSKSEADAVFDDLQTDLLSERNASWMPVIEQALSETDGLVVAAFGAAHLMGDHGVLNLLSQRGFTLQRLPF